MPRWLPPLLLYWAVISLVTVFLTCLDKSRARRHRRRIPESTLLLCAALGGAAAMLPVMYRIRHKTRKPKFTVGVPLLLALHLLSILLFLKSTDII